MSEQLANLYSTTLALPYVAGSLAITVTSATGAPTTGTFTLTILDASTGDVILLFRVTSVAGTVFTGAAEGPDTNAAASSIVVGTILSAAAITQLFADHPGGGGFIQPITAPVSGNFSALNFNVGTGVVTTQTNNSSPTFITLQQADPSGTGNTAAIEKAIINADFTVTVAISLMGRTGKGSLAGLWLGDGSTNGIFFGIYNQNDLFIYAITSLTNSFGGATSVLNEGFTQVAIGPLLWLRIQETASARNYYLSCDGATFFLLFTESNTAHITTANYGIAAVNQSAATSQVSMYSFVETTP